VAHNLKKELLSLINPLPLDDATPHPQAKPDLITIHLGTNDCDGGATPSEMADRMNALFGARSDGSLHLPLLSGFTMLLG
jgi:hypothetical protein